jgi:hypothetical protein
MQGLILTALAVDRPNSGKWLRSRVSDLIRRYGILSSQKVANNSIPSKAKQEENGTVPHIVKALGAVPFSGDLLDARLVEGITIEEGMSELKARYLEASIAFVISLPGL